ncbi:MAG: hypothetical protein K2W96_12370 [Gemmataceae bacterium]|nr:hypothetical protein [Gemmataceae bacterium]
MRTTHRFAAAALAVAALAVVLFWNTGRAQDARPSVGDLPPLPSVDDPFKVPPKTEEKRPESNTLSRPATPAVPLTLDQPMPGPVGSWEREYGSARMTLRVEMRSLVGTLVVQEKGQKVACELRADYSTTKDSILYGVVTNVSMAAEKKDADAAKEEMALQKDLMDWPFSIRFRVDGDTLTIKDVKAAFPAERKELNENAGLLVGSYKRSKTVPVVAASGFARPVPAEGH